MLQARALPLLLVFLAGCEAKSPATQPKVPDKVEQAPEPQSSAKPSAKSKHAALETPEVVHVFKNGLRIEDYALGEGPAAQVGSQLSLRYVGRLEDGRIFGHNRNPEDPEYRFRLPQKPRVAGWGLGLRGMRAGGKRKIIVPPHLAYGELGDSEVDEGEVAIPPNATLIYYVQLSKVEPPIRPPRGPGAFKGTPVAKKRHANGLLVQDYRLGKGDAAQLGDRVEVHYTGALPGEKPFDSTLDGKPMRAVVGQPQLLRAWSQGLVGMKAGGLRKLTLPPSLGYGKRGNAKIPPNSTLEFTLELVSVTKP